MTSIEFGNGAKISGIPLDTSTTKWPSNRMSGIGATAVKVQLTPPLVQLLNSVTPPEEQKVDVEKLSDAISSMTYTREMNLAHEYLGSKIGLRWDQD